MGKYHMGFVEPGPAGFKMGIRKSSAALRRKTAAKTLRDSHMEIFLAAFLIWTP